MNLSDFFRIFKDNNEEITKVLKMAIELAAVNASSVESNMSAIFELTGLYQKMEYWADEAKRLKTKVDMLIDHKDTVKAELAAVNAEKFLLETNYKHLSAATKELQTEFKKVNDENDRLRKRGLI